MSASSSPRESSPEHKEKDIDVRNDSSAQSISGLQASAPAPAPAPAPPVAPEEVSGLKLWMIMSGITLTCFLMLLDTAILVTVCRHC